MYFSFCYYYLDIRRALACAQPDWCCWWEMRIITFLLLAGFCIISSPHNLFRTYDVQDIWLTEDGCTTTAACGELACFSVVGHQHKPHTPQHSGVSLVFTAVFFKALSKVNCSKYVGGHHGRSWTHFSGGAEHSFPMKLFCFRRLAFYNIDVNVLQYSQYSKTASTKCHLWFIHKDETKTINI